MCLRPAPGVIFSRVPAEGTFPLESVGYTQGNSAPDIILSLRWSGETNSHGAPGLMTTMGGTAGKGSHASLSRYDMNNTLVAHGPNFKRGFIDDMPTGNIDVAPTILWLLGVQAPSTIDGRVLHEALAKSTVKPPNAKTETIE